MITVYIGVGSNLGGRLSNIRRAQSLMESMLGVRFLRSSSLYETEPVGGPPQGMYLNAVWEIETEISPEALLKEMLVIEESMGRVRKEPNGPREIDLDILFYGDQIISAPGVRIPHPRLHERAFVLQPFMELSPDFIHPVMKKTVRELYGELEVRRQDLGSRKAVIH